MRRSTVLFVLVLGTMMAAIDSTVVLLALPTITTDLKTNLDLSIWTILIYLLVVAVMTTQLGRIGDILGRSRMYNLGFAIFTIGSALCGVSASIEALVAFRGVQAFGASMLQANSGAIIADTFPSNERGRAYGYTSIGWNVGATLGIVVGGVLTTLVGWRYIFFINLPIGAVAIALGLKYIKDVERVKAGSLDVVGMSLLLAGLSMITYGASDVAGRGINLLNGGLIIGGVIVVALMLMYETRVKNPILDLRAFTNRVLAFSVLASFFQSTGYLSVVFVVIMYLQGIRGLSPLNASLLLVPGYVVASSLGPFAGRLSDKIGARIPATLGIAMMMGAILIYLGLTVNTPLYVIILASVVGGLGSALFYPANNSAVMANAKKGFYGGASGLLRTLANLGTLTSYVLTITVASLSIPRYVAFEVFLGTSDLLGGVAQSFLVGIKSALVIALVVLAVGMALSAFRGKEERVKVETSNQKGTNQRA
ncbi:MFS transporter [Metallosphaera tengchongensis]|uniref:MFS transporter n=1 Tax=Metallosphaera tengchongensis TaxID=1532350 RepID=A0A6N0NV58_9CREN|nr:MFS transporter [Metallosphaera tengchongensis]QKR00612.1 MFS transporter [Metallosphaera tengchongensis]